MIVDALTFLRRCAADNGRIVASNALFDAQLAEAEAEGRVFLDDKTTQIWAIIPWHEATYQDVLREQKQHNVE